METNEVTREKLVSDIMLVIGDAEELLNATASQAGEKITAARARIQANLKVAKKRLDEAGGVAADRAKVAAKVTDEFVRDHPWQAVGVGAAVGLILGMLISRR
jgi:ElaB/YqjD/DUF883 family membrane-anchored ribosome-binding protein